MFYILDTLLGEVPILAELAAVITARCPRLQKMVAPGSM